MPLLLTFLWLRSAFCAPNPRELIVGGYSAAKGRYPYFAEVQFYRVNGAESTTCGGTLVAQDIILTAAHCYDSGNFSLASSFVRVGIEDKTVTTGYYQAYMEKVIPHPSYNSSSTSFKDDVLVIKLKTAITQVAPVTLNTNSAVPAVDAPEIVFGFGDTSFEGTSSNVLLEVGVNAVSYTTCNNHYRTIFDAGMICGYSSGKASCQGDSGGPIILAGSSSAATDIQVGIVSFAEGCAKIDVPSVYTRVSYYEGWIHSQICLWSLFKPITCASKTDAPTSAPAQTPLVPPTKTRYTCDQWRNDLKFYGDDFRRGDKNGWKVGKVNHLFCSGSFPFLEISNGDRMTSKSYKGLPKDAKGVKVEFDFLEIKNANEQNNHHNFNKLDYTINGKPYQLGRRSRGREQKCNLDHATVHHVSITVNRPPHDGKVYLTFKPKVNHAGYVNIIITPICYQHTGDASNHGNSGNDDDNGGSHTSGGGNGGGSHNSTSRN